MFFVSVNCWPMFRRLRSAIFKFSSIKTDTLITLDIKAKPFASVFLANAIWRFITANHGMWWSWVCKLNHASFVYFSYSLYRLHNRKSERYRAGPRSRLLGFREETQNYAKRNRSQIFFFTCFVYRITSVIINLRFLQIVENNIIRLISNIKGSVITRCLCALSGLVPPVLCLMFVYNRKLSGFSAYKITKRSCQRYPWAGFPADRSCCCLNVF